MSSGGGTSGTAVVGTPDDLVRAIRNKDSAQASAQMRRHILQEGLRMGIELTIPDEHPGN